MKREHFMETRRIRESHAHAEGSNNNGQTGPWSKSLRWAFTLGFINHLWFLAVYRFRFKNFQGSAEVFEKARETWNQLSQPGIEFGLWVITEFYGGIAEISDQQWYSIAHWSGVAWFCLVGLCLGWLLSHLGQEHEIENAAGEIDPFPE